MELVWEFVLVGGLLLSEPAWVVVAWEVWVVQLLPLVLLVLVCVDYVDVLEAPTWSVLYASCVGTGTVAACQVMTLLCMLMLWTAFLCREGWP